MKLERGREIPGNPQFPTTRAEAEQVAATVLQAVRGRGCTCDPTIDFLDPPGGQQSIRVNHSEHCLLMRLS